MEKNIHFPNTDGAIGEHNIVAVAPDKVYRNGEGQLVIAITLVLACAQMVEVTLPVETNMPIDDEDIKHLQYRIEDVPYHVGDHVAIVQEPDGKRVYIRSKRGGSKKS